MKKLLSALMAASLLAATPFGAIAQEAAPPAQADAPATTDEAVPLEPPAEGAGAAAEAEEARDAEAEESAEDAPAEQPDGVVEGPEPGEAPETTSGTEAAVGDADEEQGAPHYPINKPRQLNWSFEGPFGRWDIGQLQRGLKVYREVCAACHGLDLVAFRNLEALGYSDAQVRALAAEYQIQDPLPNAEGDMFERAGIPSDYFPDPYANPEQAAASNAGAVPPDLSLIAKARAAERGFPTFVFDIFTMYGANGPDYLYSLLTGYGEEPPAYYDIQPGTHFNPYFLSGIALAMANPLPDDIVTYDDGAPQTNDQYARDVSAFLMWAAEPHLVERKATGFVVMIFFLIFGGLVYAVKRKVWSAVKH